MQNGGQLRATSKSPRVGSNDEELAVAKGITPAQLALAWVLAQDNDIVPIPGTKRRRYLEKHVARADLTLTPLSLPRSTSPLMSAQF